MAEWLGATIFNNSVLGKLLASIVLLVLALGIRVTALRAIRNLPGTPDMRRRWLVGVRNANILLFLIFVGAVWATELQTFALSLVAVAAAIAISTKEMIQCLVGSLYRSSTRLYSLGDRVEIGDHRGDVIDVSLMSTTMLEVGPKAVTHQQTGRAITIPHSQLLVRPVVNETYSHRFVLHTFTVPLALKDGWSSAPDALLQICRSECEADMTEVHAHFERLSRTNALEVPNPEPRVTLQIQKPDEVSLVARVPARARLRGRIEQKILQRFLSEWLNPRLAKAVEAGQSK